MELPGPLTPCIFPSRKTTTRSDSFNLERLLLFFYMLLHSGVMQLIRNMIQAANKVAGDGVTCGRRPSKQLGG